MGAAYGARVRRLVNVVARASGVGCKPREHYPLNDPCPGRGRRIQAERRVRVCPGDPMTFIDSSRSSSNRDNDDDLAVRVRAQWRRILQSADRRPTDVVHLQFRRPMRADRALALASDVRHGLGRTAGAPVEHLAVAEANRHRRGHHLHVLYWRPPELPLLAIRRAWERRARSIDIRPAYPESDAGDGRWTTVDAIRYVTKHLHWSEAEYDPLPHLLRRIGAEED